MHRWRLVPGLDFVLGLGLKLSVRAVNKKPRTRNRHDTDAFLSHLAQLFSPKTAGHSIFGPPSDIMGVISDPSQVNTLFTHYSKSAKLFLNGIYYVHK